MSHHNHAEASRNPYHEGEVRAVRQSLIAWMDILGYQAMVEDATREGTQQELFKRLYEALDNARQQLEDRFLNELPPIGHTDMFALKAFTDNIVIAWPVRDDAEFELGQALFKVANFQLEMANAGFFVRGAISLGDAFVDDIVVFGDAILEAYKGESVLARDPRVILCPSALEAANKHLKYYTSPEDAPHYRELFSDVDGQWFVSYLEAVLLAEDEHGPFYEFVLAHKDAVERKLDEFRHRPNIWTKYSWVAGYHNYFCAQYPNHFDESYRVSAEKFQVPMGRIVSEEDQST